MCMCRFTVLSVVLIMVCYISLCNGGCFGSNVIPGLRGCLIEDIFIPFDTTVEFEPCLKCTCYMDGIDGFLHCCSVKPRLSYGDNCIEIPDGPCLTKVVMKHNTSLWCDSVRGVGK